LDVAETLAMITLLGYASVNVRAVEGVPLFVDSLSVVRGCGHPFDSCPVTGVRWYSEIAVASR